MSSGSSVRTRHDSQSIRPSHGEPPAAIDIGLPMWVAREGEQVYAPDIAPLAVVTGTFDPSAAAPQVNNAPAIAYASGDPDAAANVFIDEEGLHVLDGAIFLEDLGGESVLSPAGFAGSWLDFLATGFYNDRFAYGSTNAITAATIVNTAETTDDYIASISADLPYWIVESESGAGTLSRVADSTASGGFALKWDGNETAQVFQDVPVQPGQDYVAYLELRYTNSASGFDLRVSLQFTDSDHALLGSAVTTTNSISTTQATYTKLGQTNTSGVAPSDAAYLRVMVRSTRTSGSPEVWINGVSIEGLLFFGRMRFGDDDHAAGIVIYRGEANPSSIVLYDLTNSDPRWQIEATGEQSWGDGSGAADVALARSGANQLAIEGSLVVGNQAAGGTLTLFTESANYGIYLLQNGDSDERWSVIYDGRVFWGDGSNPHDAVLGRLGADTLFVTQLQQYTEISPAQITANTNDYAPTDGNASYLWYLSTDASRNLTGIVPNGLGVGGETHLLFNTGSFNLVLVHDATSSAANRFLCAGGTNKTLTPGDSAFVIYDINASRWRVVL